MPKHRLPPGDDGHTIAPMDIPGTSWRRKDETKEPAPMQGPAKTPLTGSETRWFLWGALKAALLVGTVFSAAMAGFALLVRAMWR